MVLDFGPPLEEAFCVVVFDTSSKFVAQITWPEIRMRPQSLGMGAPSSEAITRRSLSRGPWRAFRAGAEQALVNNVSGNGPHGAANDAADGPAEKCANGGTGILQNNGGHQL